MSETAGGIGSTSSVGGSGSGTSSGSTTALTSSSSGAVDSTGSSSTSDVLDGPGCGEPPPCDGTVFEGSVRIQSADDLAMIEGVSVVTGFVEVLGSDLECLDAFACLEEVGRDIRLQGNAALRSTAGLANLSAIGTSVDGDGDVVVMENPAVESLEGFAIRRVDGVIAVRDNEALREIPGFARLRRLATLTVQDNPALESLEGLHDLNRLSRCDVSHNPVLCLSQVFAVCGDVAEVPAGVTVFNDDAC